MSVSVSAPKIQINNQNGQLTIEAALLLAVLIGGSVALWKYIKSHEWAEAMVEEPWKPLKGMIEDGEWQASGSKANHPNLLKRHGSRIGDESSE